MKVLALLLFFIMFIISVIIAFLCMTLSAAIELEFDSTESNEYLSLTQRSATFESNLYSAIKNTTGGNIIISPFSIQASAALIYAGAEGETANEIRNGFHLCESKSSNVMKEFHSILNEFASSPYVNIANRIYFAEGVNFKPEFRQVASQMFLSETENLDFTQTNEAADHINNWILNATNKKINKVIDSNALSEDTKMLLVNAIHFNGGWKEPFESGLTEKAEFWISHNQTKQVQMMKVFREFKFKNSHELNSYVLEMDYNNTDISMMVILPKSRTGLPDLEEKLRTVNVIELSQILKPRDVRVHLPKFKIQFSIDLRDKLAQMGVRNMFSDRANFNRMVENEKIRVDQMLHKAFIDVNEEGTEATAVTTIRMSAVTLRPRRHFRADHPFFFAIKSKTAVLFVGRYIG